MRSHRVVVVGAGMGGLVTAIDLARRGVEVTVLERAAAPGGKMREVAVGGAAIDAGPTVFTMRWVLDGLFADAGTSLDEHLVLHPADILARHAWRAGGQLDLFADIDRSAEAIAALAGPGDAKGYRAFCARAADIYRTLVGSFIAAERPSTLELVRRVGPRRLGALWRTAPYSTMWTALGQHFEDRRLRQLFGRYATYCGSSPWLAPATLMLVAHVEQSGVWLVQGGMARLAGALRALGEANGARFRFESDVAEILTAKGRASGVRLASGERFEADAVVFNGDPAALAAGRLGDAAMAATIPTRRAERSLSAVTWCIVAKTAGFPLRRHNVFFAEDYASEFRAIFEDRSITAAPTVYVCAQDREEGARTDPVASERLLVLINAPPDGDLGPLDAPVIRDLRDRTFGLLRSCGLEVDLSEGAEIMTSPHDFERLFPATGGALYGRASHGADASFERPSARSRLPGLYLAGGAVHPGPGVPMAAMSGRLAAARLLADLARPRHRGTITIPVPAAATV